MFPKEFREIRQLRMSLVLLTVVITLALGAATPALWANGGNRAKDQISFADARVIIEFNSTDEDVGIQLFLDGEPWKTVRMVSPDGRNLLDLEGKSSLKEHGLTELFFESAQPPLEQLTLDEFLARFPEGEYQFFGTTVEGDKITGAATLTHNIPEGPVVVSPAEGAVLDPDNAVISWESVDSPAGIDIVAYQVIVSREDPLRVLSLDLSATTTSVTVPPEFLEPSTEYGFEVLAIEAGGNQTITESVFRTE
jgi:hypothetical protein